MRSKNLVVLMCATALGAACTDNEITAVYSKNVSLAMMDGNRQYALPGAMLPDPLRVRLEHYKTRAPAPGQDVTWRLVAGRGAEVVPDNAKTDANGIATARVRLGADTGTYVVEATFTGNFGTPKRFTLTAAAPPSVASIEPDQLEPGQLVIIRGDGFRSGVEENVVYFDNLRAQLLSATPTELRAIVPFCITTRRSLVRAGFGAVLSAPVGVSVGAPAGGELRLGVGQVQRLTTTASLSCLRFPAQPAGAEYLIAAQNTSTAPGSSLAFALSGLTGEAQAAASLQPHRATQPPTYGDVWDAHLRQKENQLLQRGAARARSSIRLNRAATHLPALGEEREFAVPDTGLVPTRVSAVVRALSRHAIIYVDQNAPAGGFSAEDYYELARQFDNPIYRTDVDVFGEPSDLDGNERVLILLSPAVNQLTPKGANGYIAGFFNPCDLVEDVICGGNLTEVFYAVVPDPAGKFGLEHKRETLLRSLPSVLAHELQHMIHFNRRVLLDNNEQEDLWLQEALAHSAEDTVGGVFLALGDEASAHSFREKNYRRAALYLANPAQASIVDFQYSGTLEERGGAWLFLKYLTDRFGGDVLQRLTENAHVGTANVTSITHTDWQTLLGDFAVALYAASLPPHQRGALNAQHRYRAFDLSAALRSVTTGAYPLQTTRLAFGDFVQSATLRAATTSYTLLSAGQELKTLHLSVTAPRGLALRTGAPLQLLVMRIR